MKLKINGTKESGNIEKERVVLGVVSRTDVGGYLVSKGTYAEDGNISNRLGRIFWFPDKIVEQGDFVVLYTRSGANREFENKSGSTTHVFYWGLDKPVWQGPGDAIVLLEVSEWSAKKEVLAR